MLSLDLNNFTALVVLQQVDNLRKLLNRFLNSNLKWQTRLPLSMLLHLLQDFTTPERSLISLGNRLRHPLLNTLTKHQPNKLSPNRPSTPQILNSSVVLQLRLKHLLRHKLITPNHNRRNNNRLLPRNNLSRRSSISKLPHHNNNKWRNQLNNMLTLNQLNKFLAALQLQLND